MNVNLQERNYLIYENSITGEKLELPGFTCCHCNRVIIKHPKRERPRNVCRKCMALTCDSPGCIAECNPFEQSVDQAISSKDNQPYLLRENGWPVSRIVDKDGTELLVVRRDYV